MTNIGNRKSGIKPGPTVFDKFQKKNYEKIFTGILYRTHSYLDLLDL